MREGKEQVADVCLYDQVWGLSAVRVVLGGSLYEGSGAPNAVGGFAEWCWHTSSQGHKGNIEGSLQRAHNKATRAGYCCTQGVGGDVIVTTLWYVIYRGLL
jgi:hypothetical protein